MAFSNTNTLKTNIEKFVSETLKKTVSASRSRLVIFCVILFLQFLAVPIATVFYFPNTYDGITKKMAFESRLILLIELTKYILFLILLIRSPAERSGKRRFAKYIVLLGSLYLWMIIDIMFWGNHNEDNKYKLAMQSFKENAVPIYGQVVFASYKRNEYYHKRVVAVAEKVSAQTNGYIVIVQLNDSIYTYSGLKTIYHYFNDYAYNTDYNGTLPFRTNISKKIPNLPNCLQLTYTFPGTLDKLPDLPAVGKYVKIMYDPIKDGIPLYTDTATVATPTFDSIPGVNRQQRGN